MNFNKILSTLKDKIRIDGLLHFLVCYALTLTLIPFVGMLISSILILCLGLGKEIYDYIDYKPTFKEMGHDILCDIVGIVIALLVYLLMFL